MHPAAAGQRPSAKGRSCPLETQTGAYVPLRPCAAGGGMEAKKKSQKRQRYKQIKTPCTLEEFNAIAAKAEAADMTRAAWSRASMLGDAGPRAKRRLPTDQKALLQILGQLGRIGGNINQIAKQLNTGEKAHIPELRHAMKAYLDIRNTIFAALGLNPNPPDRKSVV